jgi:ABC-type multidrug transport system fused ATPase/permease subunit
VVEHGRHHQLLARNGHYAKMWARQQAAPAA